jgi:hypothetical protein
MFQNIGEMVTLFWRNDDGGPAFDKDSRLVFDPPADGTYQVRISQKGYATAGVRIVVRDRASHDIADVTLTSLPESAATGKPTAITLLGADGQLQFSQDAAGLKIQLPGNQPSDGPYALRITGLNLK